MEGSSSSPSHFFNVPAIHGAAINKKNKRGYTALMVGALNGHHEVVEILLEKGANPNAKAKDGVTGLSAAMHGEHPEVVKLLKAYGAKG